MHTFLEFVCDHTEPWTLYILVFILFDISFLDHFTSPLDLHVQRI